MSSIPFNTLLDRLNPKLRVRHVGSGKHVNGGPTVLWGLVCLDGEQPSEEEVETALKQAGYDFQTQLGNPGFQNLKR